MTALAHALVKNELRFHSQKTQGSHGEPGSPGTEQPLLDAFGEQVCDVVENALAVKLGRGIPDILTCRAVLLFRLVVSWLPMNDRPIAKYIYLRYVCRRLLCGE